MKGLYLEFIYRLVDNTELRKSLRPLKGNGASLQNLTVFIKLIWK